MSTSVGALFGIPSMTTYLESSAGVEAGGKTGLTVIFTGICFLLMLFFSPIVLMIPTAATAPVLIYIGIHMLGAMKNIDYSDMTEYLPAFLCIGFTIFANNIANGICIAIPVYVLMKLISGKIKETDPDGIFLKYSAIAGKPYKKIKSYSADSKAASVDWFYLCTPISEWKANARSIPYKELTENPYDHVDHPIELEGEVQEIYESTKYAYFKIKDDAGNPYLFRAVTLKTDKFATPCIPNLSVGDRIKVYGVYNGLSEISDSSTILYHRLLGYKKSFDSFKDWIISEDAMKQYSDLVSVTDVEALDSLPEFTTICGEIEDDDTTADPMHLTKDYREICKYPLYYADSKSFRNRQKLYMKMLMPSQTIWLCCYLKRAQDISIHYP